MFYIKPEVKAERVPSLTCEICCLPIRLLRIGDILKLNKEILAFFFTTSRVIFMPNTNSHVYIHTYTCSRKDS